MNLEEVGRKARRSAPEARRRADATHAALLDRISVISDVEWSSPVSVRSTRPLGTRLGSILGGPAGLFRHDEAHLGDLRAFADEHGV